MAIPGNLLSLVTEMVDPNTSGWTSMLNSTLSLGTGGRNGDGTLVVTSVAAGEMRARTVSLYRARSGTTYQALCDASGATVPERIGIRWLTIGQSEISITWSLTALVASTSWHRLAVAGVAPANAYFAQVVVSSTPAGAGVTSSFENFYLGLPITTDGNLLPFNTSTFEIDTSGWTVDTNASISRQLPTYSYAVTDYTVGGHTLAMAVTANGNAAVKTASPVAAAAGREYLAFALLNPPTSSSVCWVEIRFVDGSGTVLGTKRSTLAPPGTGIYRQIASGVAPAGTTGLVVAAGITGGTAAQVMRVDTAAVLDVATAKATGLLGMIPAASIMPFEDAEFEEGLGTWTVASGSATMAQTTPWGTNQASNAYALKVTFAGAGTTAIKTGKYAISAATGDSWGTSLSVKPPGGSWQILPDLLWYNASGTLISSSSSSAATLPGASWWTVSQTEPVPAGAASVAVQYTITAPGAGSIYLDLVAVLPVLPDSVASVQADSASVLLTLRGLTPSQAISVWRVTPDGMRTYVRGSSGLLNQATITAETMILVDYEAPLGVPISYYYETYTTAGGTFTSSDSFGNGTVVPSGGINWCWLKDPGNPQRNMQLLVAAGPDWTQPIEQAAYIVRGRRNKVIRSGIRNGEEGDLKVFTRSDDERLALDWLLASGAVLLWQTDPAAGVGDKYVNVGAVDKSRSGQLAQEAIRTWTLPLVEADQPVTTGVNGTAGRTWQDILTTYATWNDVLAAYATWEDVLLDQRKT